MRVLADFKLLCYIIETVGFAIIFIFSNSSIYQGTTTFLTVINKLNESKFSRDS